MAKIRSSLTIITIIITLGTPFSDKSSVRPADVSTYSEHVVDDEIARNITDRLRIKIDSLSSTSSARDRLRIILEMEPEVSLLENGRLQLSEEIGGEVFALIRTIHDLIRFGGLKHWRGVS